jgi:hypothetical protein
MNNAKTSKSLCVSLILFGIMCLYFICLISVPSNKSDAAVSGLKGPGYHVQNKGALLLSKSDYFSLVSGFAYKINGQKRLFLNNNFRAVATNRVVTVRLHSMDKIVISIRPEIILIVKLQHILPGSDDPPDIS